MLGKKSLSVLVKAFRGVSRLCAVGLSFHLAFHRCIFASIMEGEDKSSLYCRWTGDLQQQKQLMWLQSHAMAIEA